MIVALLLAAATPDAHAELAEARAPLARMGAALVRAARRPPALAIAATGNADDQRRLHAALAALRPSIETRAEAARAAVRRADMRAERATLPRGEEAAALDALIAGLEHDAAAGARLATVEAPAPLPNTPRADHALRPVYRPPVVGHLLVGTGEAAASGVRSRGLMLATRTGAPVIAPAAGEVAYAGRFRQWPAIVILRHGHGWTSLVTGLDDVAVKAGGRVAAGQPLGHAGTRIGIELRRDGRPVDVTGMMGQSL